MKKEFIWMTKGGTHYYVRTQTGEVAAEIEVSGRKPREYIYHCFNTKFLSLAKAKEYAEQRVAIFTTPTTFE